MKCIGKNEEANAFVALCTRIADAINKYMIVEGPFGAQISGGVNLGENDGFYINDDILYYDGEDSGSALAPIYGIYDFDFMPWINYHRFARSLWCSNYDPELMSLYWFPWGGPVDGTAYVSQLGGSITREELLTSFSNMIEKSCDATGSIFWWPLGLNKIRRITRCSQGQGAWVWQYLEQWLGIKIDGYAKTITVCPRGLLTNIDWKDMAIGSFRFDIKWVEQQGKSILQIKNKNNEPWTVKVGFRDFGAGVQGAIRWQEKYVNAGEETILTCSFVDQPSALAPVNIPLLEAEAFGGEDQIVFNHYGVKLPGSENGSEDLFLLRYVLINGRDESLKDVEVSLKLPNGWFGEAKPALQWIVPSNLAQQNVCIQNEYVQTGERIILPFWVQVPEGVCGDMARFDGYPFAYGETRSTFDLLVPIKTESEDCLEIKAFLNAKTLSGTKVSKSVTIPVILLRKEAYTERSKAYFGNLFK